jgi:hypothetical protein
MHPTCLAILLLGAGSGRAPQESQEFRVHFMAIDKFTKWIEYKPLIKYSAAKAVKFIQDIMHCFGIPNRIITVLGSLFIAIEFKSWTQDCGISIDYASIAHPEANG